MLESSAQCGYLPILCLVCVGVSDQLIQFLRLRNVENGLLTVYSKYNISRLFLGAV